jgi:hypothetical protein
LAQVELLAGQWLQTAQMDWLEAKVGLRHSVPMFSFLAEMVDLAEPMQQEMQVEVALVEILGAEQALLELMALTGHHPQQEQVAHKQVEVVQQALELLVLI